MLAGKSSSFLLLSASPRSSPHREQTDCNICVSIYQNKVFDNIPTGALGASLQLNQSVI